MDAADFHKGIEVYTAQVTAELLESKIEGANGRQEYPCPKCKSGRVTVYPKVARCGNESCGLTVFRNKSGKDLTEGQLKDLLAKGKTGVIKGFRSKEGKPFDAAVAFDAEYKTVFRFDNPKNRKKK
jgi:DNA topoisomerase-3